MNKQPILIGKPRNMPIALIKALKDYLKTVPSVKSAYIAQIFNLAANELPHVSVGLLIDEDLKNIAHDLDEIIQGSISDKEFVEVIDLNSGDMKQAFSSLVPFYVANKK